MILKSLNQDLSRIEANRQPTVDHILQAINSLCTDIQYHCGEDHDIYGGPVRNYRVLNNCLTRLASMLCDIYDAHSDDIRREALVSFPDKIRTVEQETRENERLLQEQKDKRDELTQAENVLQQTLRQRQANLEQLQQQENQLRQGNQELEGIIGRIQRIDLTALENTKAALTEQKRQLEEQKASQQAVIDQLNLDLTGAQAEDTRLSALAAAAAEKKQELDSKIEAHKQLLTQLANVDSQIQTANTDLEKARAALETATKNRDQLLTQISNVNTAAGDLQQKSADLSNQLAAANGLRQQRQNEHDNLSQDLTDVNNQIDQLKEQSDKLRTELEQGRDAITNANTDISRLESDIHTVEEERTALSDRIFVLTEELDYQKQQNEAIRTGELQEAEAALAEAKVLLRELTVQCSGLKEEQQSLIDKRRQVDGDIRCYTRLTKAQKDALENKATELAAARQAYEAKEAELDEIDRKIRGISDELTPLQEKINESQALYDSYDVVSLKAMYGRTHDDLKKKTAAAEQMQKDLKAEANKLEKVRSEYENLLSQKAHIEGEFLRVNAELSGLREPGVQEELRKLQANIEVLDKIRGNILLAFRDFHVNAATVPTTVPAAMDMDLNLLRAAVDSLRAYIHDYTTALADMIPGAII